MEFKEFKQLVYQHIQRMFAEHHTLYVTDVDKDVLYERAYLDAFPEGTNTVYRERREFDCSACKSFIRQFGNVVAITDANDIITIWGISPHDDTFQVVADTMAAYVRSQPIIDIFATKEGSFGVDVNYEQMEDGRVRAWEHFFVKIPNRHRHAQPESVKGTFRDTRNVFQRSVEEITQDAIETVLELCAQNSLYKGEEWKHVLDQFLDYHRTYHALNPLHKNAYCWRITSQTGQVVGKIRNHSIGTLLTNISDGMDLNLAVSKYEHKERQVIMEEAAKRERKQKLLSVLAEKQDAELRELSAEEIEKMIQEL